MTDQKPSDDAVVLECDLDEPPEKVWRALTERELLEAWLTPEDGGAEPKLRSAEYEVLVAEPHRLLRYGCRDREDVGTGSDAEPVLESTVTFELSPGTAGGTHLRLIHTDFRIVAQAQRAGVVRALRRARTTRGPKAPITSSLSPLFFRRAA